MKPVRKIIKAGDAFIAKFRENFFRGITTEENPHLPLTAKRNAKIFIMQNGEKQRNS